MTSIETMIKADKTDVKGDIQKTADQFKKQLGNDIEELKTYVMLNTNKVKEDRVTLQEKYNDQTEAEKEEMTDHFNSAIENLGDTLFGDEPNIDDFRQFVQGLKDEEEEDFMTAVRDALLIEEP